MTELNFIANADSARLFSSPSELFDDLARSGFDAQAPIDIDKIAELLGVVVEVDYSLEQENIIGQITFCDEKPVIKINPFQNSYSPRRRFTIAHELGHYCLHSATSKKGFTDSSKSMSRTESYWDPYESEANAFAAHLLMPKPLILSEGKKIIEQYKLQHKIDSMPMSLFTEKMADKFQVSSIAMKYRLKNLGISK